MIAFYEIPGSGDSERYSAFVARHLEQRLDEVEFGDGAKWREFQDWFPGWGALQHPDACRQALPELLAKARDRYRHVLSPLEDYVLWHFVKEVQETLDDAYEQTLADGDQVAGELLDPDVAVVDDLMEQGFGDADFRDMEGLVAGILKNPATPRSRIVGVMTTYAQLIPRDILADLADAAAGAPPDEPTADASGESREGGDD